MKWVEIATLIVGVLSLIGVWYAYQGVDFLRRESKARNEWSEKHARAYALIETMRGTRNVGGQQLNPYLVAFTPELRAKISAYLEERHAVEAAIRIRLLTSEQYDQQPIRETIQAVLDGFEKFKEDYPDFAKVMRLNQF